MTKKITAAFLSSLLAVVAQAAPYNHNPESPIGPLHWGATGFPTNATCGGTFVPGTTGFNGTSAVYGSVGKKQTPINIVTANVAPVVMPALAFLYDTLPAPVRVETNDHAVEVPYPGASIFKVGNDAYTLLQFHFHAPSEHAIDGAVIGNQVVNGFYDAELHLVHRNGFGDLAVVGVMLTTTLPPNPAIEAVIEAASLTQGELEMDRALNAKDMLPAQTGFYTYSGSLTTPPCTEGVRWFVLKSPVGISPGAVAKLHQVVQNFVNNGGSGYANNNRPIQDLNGRAVFGSSK